MTAVLSYPYSPPTSEEEEGYTKLKLQKPMVTIHSSPTQKLSSPAQKLPSPTQKLPSPTQKLPSPTQKLDIHQDTACIKCFVCMKSVPSHKFKYHLFFGDAKCDMCNLTVVSCEDFKLLKLRKFESSSCKHKDLSYLPNSKKQLKKIFTSKASDDENLAEMQRYLKLMAHLDDKLPWKGGLDNIYSIISKILGRKKSHEEPEEEEYDKINLPSHSRYLIATKAVEECPSCYTRVISKNLVFNLSSLLISYVCHYCELDIYMVIDPPDGSRHRIKILRT